MSRLFDDADMPRVAREVSEGAWLIPAWLSRVEQRWVVDRCHEWAAGPVPPHSARIGRGRMSVRTLCLGWHWFPYGYHRQAIDVNGENVLPVPRWVGELGRRALDATGDERYLGVEYEPDAVLINFYDEAARMGMHQDRDERSSAPVVSLSIGETAVFRFGNPHTRGRPYEDIRLASGDLFVFGGPARFAFHGVTRILPETAPHDCGLAGQRINITMRVTGL